MHATAGSLFGNPVAKANAWIDEITERMRWSDKHRSLHALRGVLHAVRDRLTTAEVAQLGAQLPLLMRGILFENWRPNAAQRPAKTLEAFFVDDRRELADLPDREFRRAVQVTLDVLANHVSRGETNDVAAVLPKEVRAFLRDTVD